MMMVSFSARVFREIPDFPTPNLPLRCIADFTVNTAQERLDSGPICKRILWPLRSFHRARFSASNSDSQIARLISTDGKSQIGLTVFINFTPSMLPPVHTSRDYTDFLYGKQIRLTNCVCLSGM